MKKPSKIWIGAGIVAVVALASWLLSRSKKEQQITFDTAKVQPANIKNSVRKTDVFNPRDLAVSSPRVNTSSSFVRVRRITRVTKIKTAEGKRRLYVTDEKSPTLKSLLITATSGINVTTALETAFKKLFTATPNKIIVPRDAAILRAKRLTAITVTKAPKNANKEKRKPP